MDERGRDLERAAVGGDLDARVRLLTQRTRAGTIRRVHIEAAAYLGDEAALRMYPATPDIHGRCLTNTCEVEGGKRHALALPSLTYCGRDPGPAGSSPDVNKLPTCRACLRSERWRWDVRSHASDVLCPLQRCAGSLAVLRAVVACFEETLPRVDFEARDHRPLLRLVSIMRWLASPDPTGAPQHTEGRPDWFDPTGVHANGPDAWLYFLVDAVQVLADGMRHTRNTVLVSLSHLEGIVRDMADWGVSTSDCLGHIADMHTIMRARLVPWLLGDEDPMPAAAAAVESLAATWRAHRSE